MNDLERVRYAAKHYMSLQGLILVPIGVHNLIMAAFQPGLVWFPIGRSGNSWDLGVPALALLTIPLMYYGLRSYYRGRFGYQRPSDEPPRKGAGLILVAVFALWYFAQFMQVQRHLPVSVMGLTYGAIFAAIFLTAPSLRWHHGVAAAVFVTMSVLPAFGIGEPNSFFGQFSRLHYMSLGSLALMCALLDHLLLRRLFSGPGLGAGVEHAV